MITVGFIAACVLTVYCVSKIRRTKRNRVEKRLSYYLCKNALEFLIPCISVLAFYFLLELALVLFADFVSLQNLVSAEVYLSEVKDFSSNFKLTPMQTLVILIGFFLIGLTRLPSSKWQFALSMFQKYARGIRIVYVVLVLLTSFTLLGTQVGKPTDKLRLKIVTIREGYAELAQGVKEELFHEAVVRAFDKVRSSFDDKYKDALNSSEQMDALVDSLRKTCEEGSKEYDIDHAASKAIIESSRSQLAGEANRESKIRIGQSRSSTRRAYAGSIPSTVTYGNIKNAKASLDRYGSQSKPKAVKLLQLRGGRELVMHIPKVVTSELRTTLLGQWLKSYPILEPLVNVFERTANEQIGNRLNDAVDRALKNLVQNPSKPRQVIESESQKMVSEISITIPDKTAAQASRASKEVTSRLSQVSDAKKQVVHMMIEADNQRINRFIRDLTNSNADRREAAVQALRSRGDRLSESHVQKLVHMLDYGKEKWEVRSWRESHCTWYEYKDVRHYVGRILRDVKSPYVNQHLTSRSRKAVSNGVTKNRVTDLGWI